MHPRLFTFGNVTLPTYGACLALAVMASLLLAMALAKRTGLDSDRIWTLGLVAVFGAIVSSRLFAIGANWASFRASPKTILSLPALATPGLYAASLVVAFCISIGYLFYAGLPILRTLDVAAPSLAIGQSTAAIGSLMAGSGFGRPVTGPGTHWAILFNSRFAERTTGVPLGVPLYPTQIYDSAATLAISFALLWLLARPHRDGEIAGAWLFLYGVARFVEEFYRGDAGRGFLFNGLFTGVQALTMLMVVLGGVLWSVTFQQNISNQPTRQPSDGA